MSRPMYAIQDRGYETPCWVWQRKLNEKGYGQIRDGRRIRRAHIVIYERTRGAVPNGLELDHLCNVRECVNPDHLEPVTHAVNVQRSSLAKLTSEQVVAIRMEYADGGTTHRILGQKYGVTHAAIGQIVRGEAWRELAIPQPARS